MRNLYPFVVFVTMAMICAASALAGAVRIKHEELPQPVLNTVEKLVPGSTFGDGRKETGPDGTVKYVVNLQRGEEHIRLTLSPAGKLQERTENPKFSELPAIVKKKIEYACSGEPDSLMATTPAGGQAVYRFGISRLMEADGSKRMDGQDNLGRMTGIEREEVPGPVLHAMEKLDSSPDWVAVRLGGDNAKYGASYMFRTSSKKFYVISPEGKLNETWDMTVKPADLPDSIRKMAEQATGAGEETLIRVTAAGKKPYYRFSLNGKVTADGTIIMEDEH